jgi:hypothetical protein
VTWAEDAEYMQASAVGVALMGLALLRAADELKEVSSIAGEATRGAGRAIVELSRDVHGLWHELDAAIAAHNRNNGTDEGTGEE